MEQCGTPAYIAPEILLNKDYEGLGVDQQYIFIIFYIIANGFSLCLIFARKLIIIFFSI